MITRLDKRHPLRPVDWRYREALRCLTERCRPSRLRSDKAMCEVYRCLARRRLPPGSKGRLQLQTDQFFLSQAFDIFEDRKGWVRGVIEARLLAGESSQCISQKTAVPKEIIECYRDAFYDLRGRLQFKDFVFQEGIRNRFFDDSQCRFWKIVAFVGGANALDDVLHAATTRDATQMARSPSERLSKVADMLLFEKLFVAVDGMDPSDQKSLREMLNMYRLIRNEEGKVGQTPTAHVDYLKNIEVMMANFPWSVGAGRVPPHLREWSNTAVELRANDLLRAAAGEKLDNEGELKSLPPREPGDRA